MFLATVWADRIDQFDRADRHYSDRFDGRRPGPSPFRPVNPSVRACGGDLKPPNRAPVGMLLGGIDGPRTTV